MTDREIMQREVERQGLKIAHDPDALEIAMSAFANVAAIFPDELRRHPVCDLLVYRQEDQELGHFRLSDGVCFYHVVNGRWLFAVAVACEALHWGYDYLHFLILHELAHAFVGETQYRDAGPLPHDELFTGMLDQLLQEFNRQTGSSLKNDYYDFPGYHGDKKAPEPPAGPRIAVYGSRTD